MLEDFFERVSESWSNFLDWSAEKGLPLKNFAQALEEKGIPSLPVFLLILLLLAGTAAFFLAGGTQLFAPKNSSVTVSLKTAEGFPQAGAQVFLVPDDGTSKRLEGLTDSDGFAHFASVPIGTTYTVTAVGADSNPLEFSGASGRSVTVGKKSEENTVYLQLAAPVLIPTVRVTVSESGAPQAQFFVADPDTLVPLQESKTGASVSFDLEPKKSYVITASAEGFNTEKRTITTGERDDILAPFVLTAKDSVVTGKVRIKVISSQTGRPVSGALVDVADEAGKTLFTALKSGENGQVPVQTIKLGTSILLSVRATGFESASMDSVFVADDTPIVANLTPISEQAQRALVVNVVDDSGASVLNPVIRLYDSKGARIHELTPSNGSAVFASLDSGSFYVTVYKLGYLPTFESEARRGATVQITLKRAKSDNSALVRVSVSDTSLQSVPEASVGLYYDDGRPMGVPEKYTSSDGTVDFDDLPLLRLYAKAAYAGREGKSPTVEVTEQGTGEEEKTNLLSIVLQPAKSKVTVSVRDHFTNQTLDNAKIDFSLSGGSFVPIASCTTLKGKCQAALLEGFYQARITVSGYETLTSGEFQVFPGSSNKQSFEVISSGANAPQIVFQGFFDPLGNRASSLAPSTVYNAKFLLTRPAVTVTRAEMQVRIGSADSSLDSELAGIIGYEAGTAIVDKGDAYDLTKNTPTPSPTASSTPSASPTASAKLSPARSELAFADIADTTYKYVHFTFPAFEGTKELSVQIKTKPVSTGKLTLQFRSAFDTARETLRDPADDSAVPRSILANMKSTSTSLSFGGICQDAICLDQFFEGKNGRSASDYDAQIGETFALNFQLAAPRGTVLELTAPAADASLTLKEGSTDASRAAALTTGDSQTITLTTSQDNAAGQFLIDAPRLSSASSLQLQVRSAGAVMSRTLSLRVVGPKPDLTVSVRPNSLEALKPNTLVFSVSDSNGLPVKDAYVVVGDGSDALKGAVFEGVYSEGRDGSSNYRVEGISPSAVGSVTYKVDATGFKVKRGTLAVSAQELVSLETKSISLTPVSYDYAQQSFSIQNLLDNPVTATFSLTLNNNPQYTQVDLEQGSVRLKAKEVRSINFRARILDSILPVAAQARTLSEKLQGRIQIQARTGSIEQDESIPFTISSTFTQQDLEALWSVNAQSLEFTLNPPRHASDSTSLVVTNDAQYPIIVNFESTLSNVYLEPLSQTIGAGDSAEFRATARGFPLDPCNYLDGQSDDREGTLTLHASTLGLTSRKRLSLSYSATPSESCRTVQSGDETATSTPTGTPTPTVDTSTPTPTATPVPEAKCAMSAEPDRHYPGNSTKISVNYYDLTRAPNAIAINCGNGRTANAIDCTGTTGTCTAQCFYSGTGTYQVSARAGSVACLPVRVEAVAPQVVITPSPTPVAGQCRSNLECNDDERCAYDPNCKGNLCNDVIPNSGNWCVPVSCGDNQVVANHACKNVPVPTYSVKGGVQIQLPIQIILQLPQGTQQKSNPDGSTYVLLPNKDSMLFESSATVSDAAQLSQNTPYSNAFTFNIQKNGGRLIAIIPAGVYFEIPAKYARQFPVSGFSNYRSQLPSYAQSFSQYGWELNLPVSSYLDFPSETDFTRDGSNQVASLQDFDITYPISSQQFTPYSNQERRVNVGARQPIRIELTPMVTSQSSIDVQFPVDTTFILQEFVRIKKDAFNGGKALQFKSGKTITLPSDSIIATDSNDFKKISIPAGSSIRIPAPYAQVMPSQELSIQLPFRVLFKTQSRTSASVSVYPDGVNAKSIGTEYVEVAFPRGGARAGLEAQDGTRTVDVLPGSQIVMGQPDLGIEGITKRVPVGFTMTLGPTVNVRHNGKDDSDLLEFPNGQRMLVRGATLTAEDFVKGRAISVPAGTKVIFGRSMYEDAPTIFGQDRFKVKFPAETLLHFNDDATIRDNLVVTPSLQVEFAARPAFEPSDYGKDVLVGFDDPVIFGMIDESIAKLQGLDFPFAGVPYDLHVEIPSNVFSKYVEEPYIPTRETMQSARLSQCTDLVLQDPDSQDTLKMNIVRFMAVQWEDYRESVSRIDFTVPANTRFVPNICQDTDGTYKLVAKFTSDVSYILPKEAPLIKDNLDEQNKRVQLRGCRNLNVEVRGRKYSLPQVEAIWFSEVSPLEKKPGQGQSVIVPADQETTFILCKVQSDKTGIGARISGKYDPLEIIPDPKPAVIEFTDSIMTATQDYCIFNRAPSPVNVYMNLDSSWKHSDTVRAESGGLHGESIDGVFEDAVRSIKVLGRWNKDTLQMQLAGSSEQGTKDEACKAQTFRLSVEVPTTMLTNGCLNPDALHDIEGNIKFFYDYENGASAEITGWQAEKLKLTFLKTGPCAQSYSDRLAKALGGFYINYQDDQQNEKTGKTQSLVFKNVGHVRYLSMVNNLDEDVTLKIASATDAGGSFISCTYPDGKEITTDDGRRLRSGAGFISKCTAKSEGKGEIDVTYTGDVSKKPVLKRVMASAALLDSTLEKQFTSSPLGDLAKQGQLTPEIPEVKSTDEAAMEKENPSKKATTSASTSLEFADPLPQPTQELAPPVELPPLDSSVMLCQTNFCTGEQLKAAYTGFAKKMQETILYFYNLPQEQFQPELDRFCKNPLMGARSGGYSKSIIVQAANTRVTFDDLKNSFKTGLGALADSHSDKKLASVEWGVKGDLTCGIQIVTAKLGLCDIRPNKDDWLRTSFIQLSSENVPGPQNQKCDETLANAALLTAEDPQIVVGREQVAPTAVFKDFEINSHIPIEGETSFLEKYKIFYLGSYKGRNNQVDVRNANLLSDVLYRTTPNVISPSLSYSDAGYCTSHLLMASTSVMGASVPALVGQFFWNKVGMAETAYGFTSTLALCAGTGVINSVSAAISDVNYCDVANVCAQGATYYLLNAYINTIPGVSSIKMPAQGIPEIFTTIGWKGFGTRFASEFGAFTAVSGAVAGYDALTGGNDKAVATADFVLPGGKLTKPIFGGTSYVAEQITRQYGIGGGAAISAAQSIQKAAADAAKIGITGELGAKAMTDLVAAGGTAADLDALITKVSGSTQRQALMSSYANTLESEAMQRLLNDVADPTNPNYRRNMEALVDAMRKTSVTSSGTPTNLWEDVVKTITNTKTGRNGGLTPPDLFGPGGYKTGTSSETQWLSHPQTPARDIAVYMEDRGLQMGDPRTPFNLQNALTDGKLATTTSETDDLMRRVLSKYDSTVAASSIKELVAQDANALGPKFGGDAGKTLEERLSSRLRQFVIRGNPEAEKDTIEVVAKVLKTNAGNAEAAAKETGSIFSQARSIAARYKAAVSQTKLSGIARGFANLVPLLGPILTSADVRPVRAELDYRFGNHVVVFNNPAPRDNRFDLPVSTKEVCMRDPADETRCFNRISADSLCPRNVPYCVYLVKGNEYAGLQQYDLITAFNGPTDVQALSDSLFSANMPVQIDSIRPGGKLEPEALANYLALANKAGVSILDQQTGKVSAVTVDEQARTLLSRFKQWCDGYDCTPQVKTAIKDAQARIDEGTTAGYQAAIQLLTRSVAKAS